MSIDNILESHSPNTDKPYILTDNDCIKLLHIIDDSIYNICIDNNYDISKLTPNNWAYICYQIGFNIFRLHPYIIKHINNNNIHTPIIPDNIDIIYDSIYKPLCDKYGQIISLDAFIDMIYLKKSRSIFYTNTRSSDTVSNRCKAIRKKIIHDREISLRNCMLTSNSNPIKYLAIGNHEYAWNETIRPDLVEETPVLSLDDIPDVPLLELSDSLTLPDFGESE